MVLPTQWVLSHVWRNGSSLALAPLAAQEGRGWDSPDEGTASTYCSLAVPKGVVPSRGGQLWLFPEGFPIGLECPLQVVTIPDGGGDTSNGGGYVNS